MTWKNILSEDSQKDRMEHQENLKDFLYGTKYTADYNSCEVIAVYHALLALKKCLNSDQKKKYADSYDFPCLLAYFERNGITCGGAFGTSPYALIRFFHAQGFPITCWRYPEWTRVCHTDAIRTFTETNNTFLFMAYNDASSLRAMIHTMCITKEPEGYLRHNDFSELKYYPTLQEAVEDYQNGKSRALFVMAVSSSSTL